MATLVLAPNLDVLSLEAVLVQAFKKTVSSIRSHNWFADTLELDTATVDYPTFIASLTDDLSNFRRWRSKRLRLVPAPKSGPWWINEKSQWEPKPDEGDDESAVKLRPLAHVPLRDQVIATAMMMCLADRIETIQGDPRLDVRDPKNRKRVVSHGNRLFCDAFDRRSKTTLRHRWGSSRVYRSYFSDYRNFIARPEIVASAMGERTDLQTVIVHSDLSKFYDRVRPPMLHAKLQQHLQPDEKSFYAFARRALDWKWHSDDAQLATDISGIDDFERVALPQGLVASGFFANVTLLDFDQALRDAFDTEIDDGLVLRDAAPGRLRDDRAAGIDRLRQLGLWRG